MAERQYVFFTLQNQYFGFDISKVVSIEKVDVMTKLPNTPRNIEGLTEIREQIVPIYNLHKRFGFEEIPIKKGDTDIIVVNAQGTLLALVIDNIAEIKHLEDKELMPPPAVITRGNYQYIQSVAKYNDELVLMIDLDHLFTEEEMLEIQSVVEA